jgi:hypothetical protein
LYWLLLLLIVWLILLLKDWLSLLNNLLRRYLLKSLTTFLWWKLSLIDYRFPLIFIVVWLIVIFIRHFNSICNNSKRYSCYI